MIMVIMMMIVVLVSGSLVQIAAWRYKSSRRDRRVRESEGRRS